MVLGARVRDRGSLALRRFVAELKSWPGYWAIIALHAGLLLSGFIAGQSSELEAAISVSGSGSAVAILLHKARGLSKSKRRRLGTSVIKAYLVTVAVGGTLMGLAYWAGL